MGNKIEKEKSPNEEEINKFISKILTDKNSNLTLIPDSLESKIYEKLIHVLLSNIKETLSTIKIEFLGNVITLNIQPINN